jgi:hypothetical protein
MAWEQGAMPPESLNFAQVIEQLDGLAQKLQDVSLTIQEAAAVLRSFAAVHAESLLEAESPAQMDALQQELSGIKRFLSELATRLPPIQQEPAPTAAPPVRPTAKARRRRRSPEIGWNVSSQLMQALDDAKTHYGFSHRRALVEYFLTLYHQRRPGPATIMQCLDKNEPKGGPRKRLHFRGLPSRHRRQISAEAIRVDARPYRFVAGLCWWGLSLLALGKATPTGPGPHDRGHTGAC